MVSGDAVGKESPGSPRKPARRVLGARGSMVNAPANGFRARVDAACQSNILLEVLGVLAQIMPQPNRLPPCSRRKRGHKLSSNFCNVREVLLQRLPFTRGFAWKRMRVCHVVRTVGAHELLTPVAATTGDGSATSRPTVNQADMLRIQPIPKYSCQGRTTRPGADSGEGSRDDQTVPCLLPANRTDRSRSAPWRGGPASRSVSLVAHAPSLHRPCHPG